MYWSPGQYPSLVGLPRTKRRAVIRSALTNYGRGDLIRYVVVVAATSALGIFISGSRFGTWLAAAPLSDWRKWTPLVVVIALVSGIYLWEVNNSIHTAVKKYLADKNA
jgi:hypothetical protein